MLLPLAVCGVPTHRDYALTRDRLSLQKSRCVFDQPIWLRNCDMYGIECTMCGVPLPGRGYDGVATYTSEIRADGSNLPVKPSYVIRDDCGRHPMPEEALPPWPLSTLVHNTTAGNAYPGYTNAR